VQRIVHILCHHGGGGVNPMMISDDKGREFVALKSIVL